MPKTTHKRINMDLDKVERKLVAQVKAMKPEYAELNPAQVARMELRYRLFEEIRNFKNFEEESPRGRI